MHFHYDLIVTSCRRFDLLKQTLKSFKEFADIPPRTVIVIEDSELEDVKAVTLAIFPDAIVINNNPQIGQMASIDKAYSFASSDYIFHCEDDWEFFRSHFIAESKKILDYLPEASMVSLRPRSELNPKVKHQPMQSIEGLDYFVADPKSHPEYFGYSFNPGLRRLEDFKKTPAINSFKSEADVSLNFKQRGFYLAYLENAAVQHIGDERHVEDPTRPPKAKTFLQRMKRSINKRMARLKRKFDSSSL